MSQISVLKNGPFKITGGIEAEGLSTEEDVFLCRCGLSKKPPYCDGSHQGKFEEKGVFPPEEGDAVQPEGPVSIRLKKDGPIVIMSATEVVGSDGQRVKLCKKGALCRCGASNKKPWCDGEHRKIGWKE